MFGIDSKPRPSLQVNTTDPPVKPKANTAKAYLIGMAATSQKLIKRRPSQPTQPTPITPEGRIISLPVATSHTIPGLTPDKGINTPPTSVKRCTNDAIFNQGHHYGNSPIQSFNGYDLPTLPSFPSNESDAECVFCSVGLSFAMEEEPIHKLKCGHYSHDRCLYRLNGSLKEIGDYDVLCSMCEHPAASLSTEKDYDEYDVMFTSTSDFAPGFRPGISMPVSNGLATRVMSRSSSFGILTSSDASICTSFCPSQSNCDPTSGLNARMATTSNCRNSLDTQMLGLRSPFIAPEEFESPTSSCNFSMLGDSDPASVSTGRATLFSSQSHQGAHDPTESKSSSSGSGSGSNNMARVREPVSPVSSTHPKANKSSLGLSARKEINSLLSEYGFSVKCSPRMQPFQILTTTDQPSKGIARVLVTVQAAPAASDKHFLSEYRFSAKDIQHSIKAQKCLNRMNLELKTFALADMTTLRLHSTATATSPDSRTLDWKDCEVYLFDNLIIITHQSTVSAAMALRHAKAQACVEPSRPTIVELRFANPDMIDLNLNVESPAIAHMWKHAFEDPAAHFPLAPGTNFDRYVAKLETYLKSTQSSTQGPFPAEIVLCLPVNSRSQAYVMQQAVRAAVGALTYRDKLGLVMFGRRGIERKVKLATTHSNIWKDTLYDMDEQWEQPSTPCTLDSVLNAAHQLLAQHQALDATASIILVSDADIPLRGVPPSLTRSRIPVHTIGLSECHNALNLSLLAQHSAGSYHYVKSNHELDALMKELIRLESQYTHKNVVLRFKPRISTKIVESWGGEAAPSVESMFPASVYPCAEPKTQIDAEMTVLEWRLGSMRMGDVRRLVLEVQGDVPSGGNILQVSLGATHALSPDDTVCTSTFRIPGPVHGDSVDERLKSLLIVSSVTQIVLVELERAMVNMLHDESRAAYDQLLLGLQRLQSVQKSGLVVSKPMMSLLEAYQLIFDTCCDDIVKNSQRTQRFMLDLLQRMWIFYSQLSLLKRDPIESVFYDNDA